MVDFTICRSDERSDETSTGVAANHVIEGGKESKKVGFKRRQSEYNYRENTIFDRTATKDN